jgi:hypothetical protein
MWSAATSLTVPSASASSMAPPSRAARASMPVPTKGASGRRRGTACFCIDAPMSARVMSSCSTKGISDVPTDTIWRGDTSMSWTSDGATVQISVVAPKNVSRSSCTRRSDSDAACGFRRASTRSLSSSPSGPSGVLAWATT